MQQEDINTIIKGSFVYLSQINELLIVDIYNILAINFILDTSGCFLAINTIDSCNYCIKGF